ncbi:MAG: thioredoxin domain-containing protein [Pyrinomonadaceae bacterium]
MKFIAAVFCLLIFTFSLFAQKTDDVIATAAGKKFTFENLKPDVREMWLNLPKTLGVARADFLARQTGELLLEIESAARKTTREKLFDTEVAAKVPAPTDAQIQAVYDTNRSAIGDKTLSEIRPQIVAYLRREPEEKALAGFLEQLKAKYKPVAGRDVNAPNLKPADILTTIAGKTITVKDFEDENARMLYDLQMQAYDVVLDDLKAAVSSELVAAEAVETNVEPSSIIAREISDKLREYTEEERAELQSALDRRLFAKYKAQFLIKEPTPFVQNISTDDDPSQGKIDAPVTIVMFSDFQCSFCARAHPVLKRVMAEYKDKIRFVVRDYPLESVHANAFRAALAAGAAGAQGKFFEYIEILYRNQTALDDASLKKYAGGLGLNLKQFELDLGNEKRAAEIRKDMADGKNYGVTSTPTIFVNGVKVRTNTADSFRNAIERALKQ